MLMHVAAFFMNHPRFVEAVGELASRVAAGVLAAGVLIHVVGGVLGSFPGASGGTYTAAQFFPGLPTWWLPEGATGFGVWGLVLALGLYAIYAGRTMRRHLEAY